MRPSPHLCSPTGVDSSCEAPRFSMESREYAAQAALSAVCTCEHRSAVCAFQEAETL